jgi:uncharacterized protein
MRVKIATLITLIALTSALTVSGQLKAASFNCATATSPREKLICDTPELSRLDDQLATAYAAARGRLSPAGGALLQRSQRNWLRFAATVCPLAVPVSRDPRRQPVNCIKARYKGRLVQLQNAGQRIGPFVFNRIDWFTAEPAPDAESGELPGFYVRHAAFPQIDNPASPVAEEWDTANAVAQDVTRGRCLGDCPDDTDNDYNIGWASPPLISVTWSNSTYAHGAPHGMFSSHTHNTLLRPGLPELTPADVFGSGQAWVPKLQALFRNEVAAGHGINNATLATLDIGSFNRAVVKPNKWGFGPNGLTVEFGAYEVGCYNCNPGPLTVPWSALKPLLAPGAVLP